MVIIQNANVYSPSFLGKKDLLIGGSQILAISDRIDPIPGFEIIDAEGRSLIPGLIDQHVHITGAGGKNGFASMTPEMRIEELLIHGTTTVVGLLGTDGATRSLHALYAKACALEQEGMTAYMHTGYYGLDPVHLMNSVQEDLIFIDKVLGCKIAIADIRSSYPQALELARLLRQVRVGGMIANKKGILHLHLGNLRSKMDVLFELVDSYQFPIAHISPTHVARTKDLFDEAILFAKKGGMIDITTGASKYTDPHLAVAYALEQGADINLITFSSDGNAGLEKKDANGKAIGFYRAPVSENFTEMRALVKNGILPLEQALLPVTINPAINLGLKHKGRIEAGADADLCMLDDDLKLTDVFAKGKQVVGNGKMLLETYFN
ncbi:MAG: beta-aspartyl-peptidase [Flavobacteriales bacterium]|nr:beta-aspartyl-peptidase [Flavobacteriales bacterium]